MKVKVLYQLSRKEAQEYWSGWPIPFPAYRPDPGIEPGSPALQADSLPTELSGKARLSTNLASFPFHTHPFRGHDYSILSAEETGSGGDGGEGRPLAATRREEVPGDRQAQSWLWESDNGIRGGFQAFSSMKPLPLSCL